MSRNRGIRLLAVLVTVLVWRLAVGAGGSELWGVPFLIMATIAGFPRLGRWVRRRRRRRRLGDLVLPQMVFKTARTATAQELRRQAAQELLAFGELVQDPRFAAQTPRAGADLQYALDAYQAGAKVLDGARGIADLAGVLVLVDSGRDRLARASARSQGRRVPEPSPLCFFNPLHGDSVKRVTWRPVGMREHAEVAACTRCAAAVEARRAPKVLSDRVDGRDVPYFEVPPERSVWSATGYGVLHGDLVGRVLRGDFTRTLRYDRSR